MAEKGTLSRVYDWFDRQLPVTELMENHATKYPTPKNLTYWWNFGSLAAIFLVVQLLTGILLAVQYKNDPTLAFDSVQRIVRDVEWGWLIQPMHAVGASFFFLVMFIHLGRGMVYGSYKSPRALLWLIGCALFMVLVIAGFTGYLLPWGQMSYWAAQVITEVFSAVPVVGQTLVEWVRGSFVVSDATLSRMFAYHIVLVPILFIMLTVVHITALHKVGSGNPTGIEIDKKEKDKFATFHPLSTAKDAWFGLLVLMVFFAFVFFAPHYFTPVAQFIEANPLQTPPEIVPEWYFLSMFAILRSIPDKLLGVIALFGSTGILFFLPLLDRSPVKRAFSRPIFRWALLLFFLDFIYLGYLGTKPPLGANLVAGQIATLYYFLFFLSLPLVTWLEAKMAAKKEAKDE